MVAERKPKKPQSTAKKSRATRTTTKPAAERRNDRDEPAADRNFLIVALGASAGGLQAFEAFFKGLPAQPGMAFVVVSHLDPSHVSLLPELIQKCTGLKVRQITDGDEVQCDSVYVAPPNKDLSIFHNRLYLQDLSDITGPRMAIDHFLRTLAEDAKDRAVCVILSGMGTDGTLGLRAIKGELGIAMVQAPDSARYDSMPRSALETHLVDYVLRPEEMGQQLMIYARSAVRRTTPDLLQEGRVVLGDLQKIYLLLRHQTGHDFSAYKQNTICRRIERRMLVHQIEDLSSYVKYLQNQKAEVDLLFNELLIGVTNFFRDPEAFDVLKEKVLPRIFQERPANSVIRAWVPGCATGEEAYSIAIVLRECTEKLNQHFSFQVFATDINEKSIETARSGLFPANIAADVTPERLKRFFTCEDNVYRIRKDIREMLVFAPQDLIKDPPFTKLDLVSCRNLLIYLDGAMQKKLLPLFHYSLKPGGILFLGSSETVGGYTDLFEPIDRKWKIFLRTGPAGTTRGLVEFPMVANIDRGRPMLETKPLQANVLHLAQRALLSRYAPPCVIVGEHGDIVFVHGRTGRFLEPAPGEARMNVFEMAREGLRLELQAAVRRVISTGQDLVIKGLRVQGNGSMTTLDLKVYPLAKGEAEVKLLLVTFEEWQGEALEAAPEQTKTDQDAKGEALSAIERELQYTKENLQSTIEELETANEELKSTNEELQSTNEELQSTNEELETSKEEQQSLNEELTTVNSELQVKIEELTQANNDMKNLLNSIEIPTIFLDNDLRIKRFTSHATRVIRLIQSDIGRPIEDLTTNLDYDNLAKDARGVLRNLIFREREIQSRDGNWFLMRILPYRTVENVIDGVVVTFQDINERKAHEEALSRQLATVMKDSNDAIVILDRNGRIRGWNDNAEKAYGWNRDGALDRTLFEMLPEDQREPTRKLVDRLEQGANVASLEAERITKSGKKLNVWITASRLIDASGQPTQVVLTERPLVPFRKDDDRKRD